MTDISNSIDRPSTFLKIYFYILLIATCIALVEFFEYTVGDIIAVFIEPLGFMAFYGYIYNKKIFNRRTWLILTPLFIIYSSISVPHPLYLLMELPRYWSVALYPFITLEMDYEKRTSNIDKRDFYVSKLKVLFVSIAVLAMLFHLCAFLIIIDEWYSKYVVDILNH